MCYRRGTAQPCNRAGSRLLAAQSTAAVAECAPSVKLVFGSMQRAVCNVGPERSLPIGLASPVSSSMTHANTCCKSRPVNTTMK